MKQIYQRVLLLTFAALVSAFLMPAEVLAQGAVQTRSYEVYRGMRTRNIFDPDRRGPRVESAPSRVSSGNRPDYLALTGTMVTSGKTLAFFTGSRSDYNKVLSIREKIADYTVTSITSTHVDLERDGKPLSLAVGKQLAMDGSGSISTNTGTASSAPAASSGSSGTSSDTTPPAGVPADKAEILRRMMERRQQENSK